MPLLRPAKNISLDDWVIIVLTGVGSDWFTRNEGCVTLFLLKYDVYTHKAVEPSPLSRLKGRPFYSGFTEVEFSCRPPATNHGGFGEDPFAILNGKPPVSAYEHRNLLRRIGSTYSPMFADMIEDKWYENLCHRQDWWYGGTDAPT